MMPKLQAPNGQAIETEGNQILAAIRGLEVIDPNKIQCLEYRVLVKIADAETITNGGVLKPASVIEKEIFANTTAEIVNAGAEAFTASGGGKITNQPKPGDRVIIAKYAGLPLRDKNYNLFRFCNDKDVVALLRG